MNILPKKNWHVRTKKNIERVRRDEEQAAEEEKERQRRIALAESEARTDLLRQRAKHRQRDDDEEYEGDRQVVEFQARQHVNFFSDIEQGMKQKKVNEEHEKEKKEEKEKWEKSIGLLTYLGQSSVESKTTKPGIYRYSEPPKKKSKEEENMEEDMKRKHSLDPLHKMKEYVEKKKKHKHKDKHKDYEKKHKHKHKDRDTHKHKSGGSSSSSSSSKKTIEQLRAERLKREQEEKLKTEQLLAKLRGEKIPGEEEVITDDRQRKYNSQFNPDLARKPKKRQEWDY